MNTSVATWKVHYFCLTHFPVLNFEVLSVSKRIFRVAFKHLYLKLWRFVPSPQPSAMSDPISERTAISTVTAFERTRDANKLRLQRVAGNVHRCVTVATHVDKRKMRRKSGVRQGSRLVDIPTLRILETRQRAVTQQQVDSRLRTSILRPLAQEEHSEGVFFRKAVLQCFD